MVKGTFNLTLYGYMVPDTLQKDVTAIKKAFKELDTKKYSRNLEGILEFIKDN